MIAFDATRGQLKLGLRVEAQKETLLEEVGVFVKSFITYFFSRFCGSFRLLWRSIISSSALASDIKFFVQRKLYRKKGQLAFPLAHASLLGVSFSLLLFTSGFGEFLYRQVGDLGSSAGAMVIADRLSVATEESELLNTKVQEYAVEGGDTLYSIAQRFRISVDALTYANNISESDVLKIGVKLLIPPVEGLVYKVKKGDTVEKIAEKYNASAQSIVEFNYLFPPYDLEVGVELIVPNAQIPQPKPVYATNSGGFISSPASSGACGPLSLSWPTSRTIVVGRYISSHRAIDLAANYEPLRAAADGVVVAAGTFAGKCFGFGPSCNHGYGGYVFIDIGGGYQIRYGHISRPLVGVGEHVSRGDIVAISGDTGYSFAPHLHFELWCGKTKINPLPYLH